MSLEEGSKKKIDEGVKIRKSLFTVLLDVGKEIHMIECSSKWQVAVIKKTISVPGILYCIQHF